jgi:hypothetical protein
MRFRTLILLLVLAIQVISSSAQAASLFFQAVPRSPTAPCQPDCYELRAFYEDSSRGLSIQTLDLFMHLLGMEAVGLPLSRPTNARANTILVDSNGDGVSNFPWGLANLVGFSSMPGFEILLLDVSAVLFEVDSMQATHDALNAECDSVCALQREGLAANRILLGRFDVRWAGGGVGVRMMVLPTRAPATDDPVEGLLRLNGETFDVAGLPRLPEPACTLLVGITLVAMASRRRMGRPLS